MTLPGIPEVFAIGDMVTVRRTASAAARASRRWRCSRGAMRRRRSRARLASPEACEAVPLPRQGQPRHDRPLEGGGRHQGAPSLGLSGVDDEATSPTPKARETDPLDVGDRFGAADRGEVALVEVAERPLAGRSSRPDALRDVAPLCNATGASPAARRPRRRRLQRDHVAEREDLRVARRASGRAAPARGRPGRPRPDRSGSRVASPRRATPAAQIAVRAGSRSMLAVGRLDRHRRGRDVDDRAPGRATSTPSRSSARSPCARATAGSS